MIAAPPHLHFEAWKDQIRKMGGRFDPQVIDPEAFAGWCVPLVPTGSLPLRSVPTPMSSSARTGMFASMARTTMSYSFNSRATQQ